jgi:DNA-binding CsgD family transcriptional regulator
LSGMPDEQGRRAWHLASAALSTDEGVARELERAAGQARGRGAPAASAAAWEAAARLTAMRPERVRRLIEAGRDLHVAGRGDHAVSLLQAALDLTDDPRTRADIQHLRAHVELFRGAPTVTRELLVAEARRIEPIDPDRAGVMLADAAFTAIARARPREALALAQGAVSVAAAAPGGVQAVHSISLGTALVLCGEAVAGYPLILEGLPLADAEDLFTASTVGVAVASGHLWLEEYAKAAELLRRVVGRLRRDGALSLLPYPLAALAEAERYLGNWQTAYASAAGSVSLAEATGQPTELGLSVAQLALVEAVLGRADDCRGHAREAFEIASRWDIGAVADFASGALGLLELGEAHFDEAIAVLEAIGRRAMDAGVGQPTVVPWARDLAEAYIRSGRDDDAIGTLATLAEQAQHTGSRSARAAVSRCRGLMADGNDELDAHFAEAMDWHAQVGDAFERARTELCFGERLRRSRRPSEARAWLRTAAATFDSLDARAWAQRARAELAATGERARARTPAAAEELTAQELQVALAVAGGATNNEAAAALFVSPKTVEAHLSRIYRKLGLRSRTQLAGLMAAGPIEPLTPPGAD